MKLYVELQLPPCRDMADPGYIDDVQRAASELRAAEPWLLVMAWGEPKLVAARRTVAMAVLTWCVNWWRRPRRWFLGRKRLAYERRQLERLSRWS